MLPSTGAKSGAVVDKFFWPAADTVRRSKPQLSQKIDPGGTGEEQFGQVVMDIE
jgi:hypothetical protein